MQMHTVTFLMDFPYEKVFTRPWLLCSRRWECFDRPGCDCRQNTQYTGLKVIGPVRWDHWRKLLDKWAGKHIHSSTANIQNTIDGKVTQRFTSFSFQNWVYSCSIILRGIIVLITMDVFSISLLDRRRCRWPKQWKILYPVTACS